MSKKSQSSIPETSKNNAIVLLIINILFPGIGTCIMACLNKFSCTCLIIGMLQIITTFLLIGWIWSIWWGVLCLQKSRDNVIILKEKSENNTYYYNDDYGESSKFLDQNNNLIIILKNKKNIIV